MVHSNAITQIVVRAEAGQIGQPFGVADAMFADSTVQVLRRLIVFGYAATSSVYNVNMAC